MTDSRIKHSGQVFTPDYLADNILDAAGYAGPDILRKHCMDNSCGDGAFLCRIAARYAEVYRANCPHGKGLKRELETYIHGIEKDEAARAVCLENLRATAAKSGLSEVNWNILHADALTVSGFDGKMDFVIGNPPYVRVHNLASDYAPVKRFRFARQGMTDLYLVFFEIGFRMLAPGGRLCYIAPGSWTTSLAGTDLRNAIRADGTLTKLIDLGHFQPFKASTYTMIVRFENGRRHDSFDYSVYDPVRHCGQPVCRLKYDEAFIGGALYPAEPDRLKRLRAVLEQEDTPYAVVKNGFATLADGVFIRDGFPFSGWQIPVIKASTGKWSKAFYPYDANGKPLPRGQVFQGETAEYLLRHREALLKGKTEAENPDWHLFGRTQALKDVRRRKYAVGSCIRETASIKFNVVPAGAGVYSGQYILSDLPENELRAAVCSENFMEYVRALKKYKSGGYYTFSARDLEKYLNAVFASRIN